MIDAIQNVLERPELGAERLLRCVPVRRTEFDGAAPVPHEAVVVVFEYRRTDDTNDAKQRREGDDDGQRYRPAGAVKTGDDSSLQCQDDTGDTEKLDEARVARSRLGRQIRPRQRSNKAGTGKGRCCEPAVTRATRFSRDHAAPTR